LQGLAVCSQESAKARGFFIAYHSYFAITALGHGHSGPLPTAQGNFKFVVAAIKYFTKWIEARPVATITSATIRKFFWQQIICRFGVPKELTVDNGKQFDCQDFREYCRTIGTKLRFASVYHPQSNDIVKRANGQIFQL
jgi:hypothetical protein